MLYVHEGSAARVVYLFVFVAILNHVTRVNVD